MLSTFVRVLETARDFHSEQKENGTTCVTLLKRQGQPLGATIKKTGEHIVFMSIHRNGYLRKVWEQQHPDRKLQPGCRLVSVNGVRDNMSLELWKAGKKVLKVMEGSLLDSCPQVLAGDHNIETCAICFEDLEPEALLIQLPCKHAFHEGCCAHWFAQGKGACPLCNSYVEPEDGMNA
mmetsp:Transcript_52071/g.91488  ORF Transcript_52071/g.91488 Transcript_52071/m.91488 type:complete len:178 (+) Transcript_52071:19-552(+)